MSTDSKALPLAQKRVALGVTGGIAAYKSIEVLRGLQQAGCEVRVAMTRHACEFIGPLTFRALSGDYVLVDDYSPTNPNPIAHITFSQTIELFIIAPATANTLGKLANGVADDFITSTYLACTAPILIAPAMNTAMWQHPATQRNVEKLEKAGVHIVRPDDGEMACGTIGPGRLSEPERIVAAALDILGQRSSLGQTAQTAPAADLSGETVVITAGATREAIDPVRFISNRSSGRMGFAIAEAAVSRGARVHVIAGITTAQAPAGVALTRVTSAVEMRDAVMRVAPGATLIIAAAAVSDYRPANVSQTKIKKDSHRLDLSLERIPDILGEVAQARREGQLIIGFAAETNNLLQNAQAKLNGKGLDLIVANDVTRADAGFDADTNAVTILSRGSEAPVELELMSKREIAHRLLDQIVKLRHSQPENTHS